ncbi:hypothetical protein ACFV94_14075 [Streptomyces sp. NPDC059896]|uniref:hypothetical protein n=1 Tax=Streptomyces sp. NPDC059896 TaxID=3346993 RepID=UPI00364E6302
MTSDNPAPFDPIRELAELKRRCAALVTAIEGALTEHQSLHTRLVLTELRKLDNAAFFESFFGCCPPQKRIDDQ